MNSVAGDTIRFCATVLGIVVFLIVMVIGIIVSPVSNLTCSDDQIPQVVRVEHPLDKHPEQVYQCVLVKGIR